MPPVSPFVPGTPTGSSDAGTVASDFPSFVETVTRMSRRYTGEPWPSISRKETRTGPGA
jgi:hypothetical protein